MTAKKVKTTVDRLIAALGLRKVSPANCSTSGVVRRPHDRSRCSRLPPPTAINQCMAALRRPAPISHSKSASAENTGTGQRDSCVIPTMTGSARWLRRDRARSATD